MFLPTFAIWIGWILLIALTRGPREGLWKGWLLAMLLLPVWLVKSIGSVTLDLRTGAALAGLGGFLIREDERLRYKFALMDLLMFFLFTAQLISGFATEEITAMTIPEIMRRWLLPYIVGHVFIASYDDFSKFLPVVAMILAVLSVYAVVEASTHVNPFCKLLGKSYPVLEAGEGYRWGIKRAQGPLDHPIFYGMMLVMTYPFAVEAGRRAWHRQGARCWLLLPFSVLAAVLFTASRRAIIAALATVYCTVAFASKHFRVLLIVLALVGGYNAYVAKDQIKAFLSAAVETSDQDKARYVEIEGKEYRYTGTAHRDLLLLVYARAIRECPFFGYGARLVDVPVADHLQQRLPERVAGSELIYALTKWAAVKGYRVSFVGGAAGVAQAAADSLAARYPSLLVASVESPPCRQRSEYEESELVRRISESKPDIVYLAFGQPKGEIWLARHYQTIGAPVCVQIGASFDFVAGAVARAPKWMQRTGLEWFYRLCQEPRRLAGRYWDNSKFLMRALLRDAAARPTL